MKWGNSERFLSLRGSFDAYEIRRHTRVVGTFPDGKSALMLVAARLRHFADSEWGPAAPWARLCSRSSRASG